MRLSLRALGWTFGSAALLLALAIGALAWLALHPAGTAFLFARLPGLVVTAPQGRLLGDFAAERVEIALPGADGARIVIGGLRWRGLVLKRAAAAGAWVRIEIDSLQADRVDVRVAADPNAPPNSLPQSLQLPFELELRALQVAELNVAPLSELPLRNLRAQLQLGDGVAHRLGGLAAEWDRIVVRGHAQIAAAAPFGLQAQFDLSALDATAPFDATVMASGPLARLGLQATLRGGARADGAKPPSLDLEATLLPYAAWPLAALHARTHGLDLAALHSSAPRTALSGTAEVASTGADRPAAIEIALANALAGRIDEGRLPLRSLKADLRARPEDPRQVEVHALALELGTAQAAGGRLQGSGHWTPQRATLAATLADVAPRVLDARAPAMRLSGRAELRADHWFGPARPDAPANLTLQGRIDGRLPIGTPLQTLRLELDASATPQGIELRQASLQGGDARATLAGRALRHGTGWQIDAQGTLGAFDPLPWWPGVEGSVWRKGPHRLNGALALQGLLPAGAAALSLQQLAAAQGKATLTLTDSVLAGAALAGRIELQGERDSGLGVDAALSLAGAKLALRGKLAVDARDHWEIDARAADLAPLSPLLRLWLGNGAPAVAGALDSDAVFDGRWPQLAARGRIGLDNARAGATQLARAQLRWTAATATQAPLEVQAEIDQFAVDGHPLGNLRLAVQGSTAEHVVTVTAQSPVRPPKWVELLQGGGPVGAAATGTLAELRAQGSLQFDPAWRQALRWRGQLQTAEARHRNGAAQPPAWFRAAGLALDAQYDPLTGTPQLSVAPGRAELATLALRWSDLRWQGGRTPKLELQAELEPFAAAPLLARLQPDFGWSGDLVLGGRMQLRSAPGFLADIEFARRSGDLSITDETATQALELTDLRLAIDARDGVWHFTQALAGRTLGAMAGAVTVRTDAAAFWPHAAAPLQGVLEATVADLAPWGAWTPAGWRLKGALHASASFGGLFGAPEYSGQIDGSGLGVRNLVEGVDVHSGELDIVLSGETAQIRKAQARAGAGSVQVSGGASFGAAPQLQLRLAAERLLVLGRVDRRIVASGEASLLARARSLQLDGRFTIDEGLIDFSRGNAPSLGDDVTVLRATTPAASAAAPPPAPLLQSLQMKLALGLGPALRLRGRGLDTLLGGELLLTSPGGRLAVGGTLNATQGTYAAYGQKLAIERGAVSFSEAGAMDNPRLDILALRPNVDIRVGVAITGSAKTPRVSLYSDPDLPDNEKLSWLVLGRAPDSRSDTALLQAAAMALLAGEGDRPGADLTQRIPLDLVSVRQTDGEVRNTVVSVGKQISQRWYIGYERSLNATAGNWQLIYRLAQRFTVRLQTGLDNSIDLIWAWRYD